MVMAVLKEPEDGKVRIRTQLGPNFIPSTA